MVGFSDQGLVISDQDAFDAGTYIEMSRPSAK